MNTYIASLFFTSLCVLSHAVMADYTRETIKTGPNGTSTVSVNQNATATGWERDRSATNPQGNTATRHTEVDKNPVTGTVTRSVDGTLHNGKTYSKDSTRTPTGSGFVKETTQVTPNGKTREKLKVVERSPAERNVDVTRVNGRGQLSHRNTRTRRK
ncbi:MAG: hypothetical protein RL497_275 [Pseudomonadota bacterium]|jgi:hypothetical protein